jgi:hypothetical protein
MESLLYISKNASLVCANTRAVIVQTDRILIAAKLWVLKREAKELSTLISSNAIGVSVANIAVCALLCRQRCVCGRSGGRNDAGFGRSVLVKVVLKILVMIV